MQVSLKKAQVALKDLEEPLNLSQPGVSKWISTRGVLTVPSAKDRRVSLASLYDVITALRTGEATEDGEAARLRKLRAEADLAEMERDKLAGRLIERGDNLRTLIEVFSALRANLLSYPDRVQTRLEACVTPAERVAVLRGEMKASLEGIVKEIETAAAAVEAS